MSIADKLITVGENVDKVYKAGQASMVDESKLVPKTVSGSYVLLDDVSEIPHNVECKLSGDDITFENVKVQVFGKNLIPYPFEGFTTNSNGITATDLGDGGVLLNGTATKTVFIHLHKTPIGNMYIEGTRTFNIGNTKCTITANKYSSVIRTVHHNNNNLTYIIIDAGTTCDNIVFYPQIEVGEKATEFEKGIPYKSFTPNADGTVDGIESVSPYMNIFCSSDAVTLDVTYNKSYGMQKCEETHDAIKEEGFTEGKQAGYDEFWDVYQSNGNPDGYEYAFAGVCWNSENWKPKYPVKLNGKNYLSSYAGIFEYFDRGLKKAPLELTEGVIDFSNCQSMDSAFANANISKVEMNVIPDSLVSYGMNSAFRGGNISTNRLKTIKLGVKEDLTYTSTFLNSIALTNVSFVDGSVIGRNINFQYSPLSKDSIKNIINVLSDTQTGRTLTIKATAKTAAFTDSEWASLIATKPNWTISLV